MTIFSFLALTPKPLGEIRGLGKPLGLEGLAVNDPGTIAFYFERVLSVVIGTMAASGIIWFVFQFIIGAYGWMSAGGDSKAVEAARKRIINAVIGLVIIFTAMVLISVIGFLLGINILNIGQFITGPLTTK